MSSKPTALTAGVASALLLAAAVLPARAAESYDNCNFFITSLPVTVSSQGVWCMTADKSASLASGTAINVTTNNVTIECNGFKLGNLGAGNSNAATAIQSNGRQNTTVRDCFLRGYYVGVQLTGSGHLIEDTRVEASGNSGIQIGGDGSIARRNRVFDTGTGFHHPYAGIVASGSVDLLDNAVIGVEATYEGGGVIGIVVDAADGGRIEGNTVRHLLPDLGDSAYGIFINHTGGGISLSRNRIHSGTDSLQGTGIHCAGTKTSYLNDNHMIGFDVGQVGCTDVADNVVD